MIKPLGLKTAIAETLHQVSANHLPNICVDLGMAPGEIAEAFQSKRSYVAFRLLGLSEAEVLAIARKVQREYPDELLAAAIQAAGPVLPADGSISQAIAAHGEGAVHDAWSKALERRDQDPDGAITSARTLLEEVCKHIITEAGSSYEEKDDLPKLYRTTSTLLNLAPSQHTAEVFKQILGGCHSVVEGLGTLRNRLGDAHGRGRQARASARHATLAVNLSGSMATFLLQTWQERQQAP